MTVLKKLDPKMFQSRLQTKIEEVEQLATLVQDANIIKNKGLAEYIDSFVRALKLMKKARKKLASKMELINEVSDIMERVKTSKSESDCLDAQIAECKNILKERNIKYATVNYTCLEEIPLSFKGISIYCSNRVAGAVFNKAKIELLEHVRDIIIGTPGNKGYYKIFRNSLIKSDTTLEKCVAKLLDSITSLNKYNYFHINKTQMMNCWYDDCKLITVYDTKGKQINRDRNYCKNCFVTDKDNKLFNSKHIAKNRFMYMVHNSIGQDIIDKIDKLLK